MFKVIRLYSVIVLVNITIQLDSFAQIINEKTVTNTPAVSILQCSDDTYIYVGTERNPTHHKFDVILTRKDINGEIIWNKTIDWEFDCTVRDAAILSDNSIVIAGSARKSIYQSYPFVMKTDPHGDTLWARHYPTGHQAEKVIGTSDGGYLFAYYSNGCGLMKLDADGLSIWSKQVGNGKPYGLAETSEAVYLVVDDEDENITLSSIDSNGEVLWKRIFAGAGKAQPVDVINASNGDDYLFAGRSFSDRSDEDFYVGLLNCFGYTAWTRTFGGLGTDMCFDLMESSNGGFIAVGVSNSFNKEGKFDFYAVKFDFLGNTIWTKTFPGVEDGDFLASKLYETSHGSFLIAGPKLSGSVPADESYLVEFIYPTQFGISFESDRQSLTSPPFVVQFTNRTAHAQYYDFVWYFGDGESLASNDNTVFHEYQESGSYDVKLVAFEHDFGSVDSLVYEDYITIAGINTSVQIRESIQATLLNIHPNPFSHATIISFDNPDHEIHTFRLFDLNGRLVKLMDHVRGDHIELSRSGLPAGIYFVELSGRTTSRGKLLIE
jgi:hypothetical protein